MGQGHVVSPCCVHDEDEFQATEHRMSFARALNMVEIATDEKFAPYIGNQVKPMFEDGTHVEYYSATHRHWLPARLKLRLLAGTEFRKPLVVYNVTISYGGGRTQVRKNVPQHTFRLPLDHGEPAEIVSKDRCRWTPCTIDGPTNHVDRRRQVGYSIRLANSRTARCFPKVPPGRLRRRFPNGATVKVYQDTQTGWITGEVDTEADKMQELDLDFGVPLAGPLLSNLSKSSCATIMPSSERQVMAGMASEGMASFGAESVDDYTASAKDDSPIESRSSPADFFNSEALWRRVPVRELGAQVRFFPGYLVYPA